jgi:ankyrin repeat protein
MADGEILELQVQHLIAAIEAGDPELVCALLVANAHLVSASRESDDVTASVAASMEGQLECLRALLEAGADVEQTIASVGKTPLMAASQMGHLDCVRALLEADADSRVPWMMAQPR